MTDASKRWGQGWVWLAVVLAFVFYSSVAWFWPLSLSWDMLNRYAPMAEYFAVGEWQYAFHPRFCLQFPTLAGSLVWLSGLSGLHACQLVSVAFWCLAAVPLWRLACHLGGRRVGWFALAFYLLHGELFIVAIQGWRDDCRVLPLLLSLLGLIRLFGGNGESWCTKGPVCVAFGQFLLITLRVDCFLFATVFLFAYGVVCLWRRNLQAVVLPSLAWFAATMAECALVYAYEGWWVPIPHIIPLLEKLA